MKVLAIIDYSYLYYKYKFRVLSGKIRRLSTCLEWKGAVIEKDVSEIYYSIKEIEGIRKQLETLGHDLTTAICFDMPCSVRKEMKNNSEAQEYKSGRTKKLSEEDIDNIEFVEKLLSDAGHNTFRIEGLEADDIVTNLVNKYKTEYDFILIYTPDKDLLVNICNNVGVMRYKSVGGYSQVSINNYTAYLKPEFKATIPYNSILLYLCTVGDKSDNVSGIKGFGPKGFDKLIDYLRDKDIDWNKACSKEYITEILNKCEGYLKPEQIGQAIESLDMVLPIDIDDNKLKPLSKKCTRELRELSYLKYDMKSLID